MPDPLDYRSPDTPKDPRPTFTCPACGSRDTVEGGLETTTRLVHFVPPELHSIWKQTGVPVLMHPCLSCGHLAAGIDPTKLRRLIGK